MNEWVKWRNDKKYEENDYKQEVIPNKFPLVAIPLDKAFYPQLSLSTQV